MVDAVGFALDLIRELLFLAELLDEGVLLGLKAVEFFSQLDVQVPLIGKVALQIAIHHILQT